MVTKLKVVPSAKVLNMARRLQKALNDLEGLCEDIHYEYEEMNEEAYLRHENSGNAALQYQHELKIKDPIYGLGNSDLGSIASDIEDTIKEYWNPLNEAITNAETVINTMKQKAKKRKVKRRTKN